MKKVLFKIILLNFVIALVLIFSGLSVCKAKEVNEETPLVELKGISIVDKKYVYLPMNKVYVNIEYTGEVDSVSLDFVNNNGDSAFASNLVKENSYYYFTVPASSSGEFKLNDVYFNINSQDRFVHYSKEDKEGAYKLEHSISYRYYAGLPVGLPSGVPIKLHNLSIINKKNKYIVGDKLYLNFSYVAQGSANVTAVRFAGENGSFEKEVKDLNSKKYIELDNFESEIVKNGIYTLETVYFDLYDIEGKIELTKNVTEENQFALEFFPSFTLELSTSFTSEEEPTVILKNISIKDKKEKYTNKDKLYLNLEYVGEDVESVYITFSSNKQTSLPVPVMDLDTNPYINIGHFGKQINIMDGEYTITDVSFYSSVNMGYNNKIATYTNLSYLDDVVYPLKFYPSFVVDNTIEDNVVDSISSVELKSLSINGIKDKYTNDDKIYLNLEYIGETVERAEVRLIKENEKILTEIKDLKTNSYIDLVELESGRYILTGICFYTKSGESIEYTSIDSKKIDYTFELVEENDKSTEVKDEDIEESVENRLEDKKIIILIVMCVLGLLVIIVIVIIRVTSYKNKKEKIE